MNSGVHNESWIELYFGVRSQLLYSSVELFLGSLLPQAYTTKGRRCVPFFSYFTPPPRLYFQKQQLIPFF